MAARSSQITFVGLGAMGTTLAQAQIRAGRKVTVWNRTPNRPSISSLISAGANFEPDVAAAISASPVTIISVLDYDTIHEILDPISTSRDALSRIDTVINVTNGTPGEAREMSDWMHAHGVTRYIDGGIMADPAMIGTPASFIFLSGEDDKAYEDVRAIVEVFGRTEYMGEDAGAAALYDLALLSGMYGMFAGVLTGLSMMRRALPPRGQDRVLLEPTVKRLLNPMLQAFFSGNVRMAECLDNEEFEPRGHRLAMEYGAMQNLTKACKEEGVDPGPLSYFFDLVGDMVQEGAGDNAIALVAKRLDQGTTRD